MSTMRYREATDTYPLNEILRVWVKDRVFWELQLVLKYSVIHFGHIVRVERSLPREIW